MLIFIVIVMFDHPFLHGLMLIEHYRIKCFLLSNLSHEIALGEDLGLVTVRSDAEAGAVSTFKEIFNLEGKGVCTIDISKMDRKVSSMFLWDRSGKTTFYIHPESFEIVAFDKMFVGNKRRIEGTVNQQQFPLLTPSLFSS